MSLITSLAESYDFNRARTLATIDRIESLNSSEALGWRPGPGRAHCGWQFMHIAITEDIFASDRLPSEKSGRFTDLWDRFRGGSQPDDNVPTIDDIRVTLQQSREHLLATLSGLSEDDLETVPEGLKERGWTIRNALHIISWHESHHQGQVHLTLNLFENQS